MLNTDCLMGAVCRSCPILELTCIGFITRFDEEDIELLSVDV